MGKPVTKTGPAMRALFHARQKRRPGLPVTPVAGATMPDDANEAPTHFGQ